MQYCYLYKRRLTQLDGKMGLALRVACQSKKKLKQRVLQETFTTYLRDNTRSWVLQSDGSYKRKKPSARAQHHNTHETLIAWPGKTTATG